MLPTAWAQHSRLMREAEIDTRHSRGTSHSGEEIRHSSALRGGYDICGVAKAGPKVRSTQDQCDKPLSIHHLESFVVIAKWS